MTLLPGYVYYRSFCSCANDKTSASTTATSSTTDTGHIMTTLVNTTTTNSTDLCSCIRRAGVVLRTSCTRPMLNLFLLRAFV